MSSRRRAPRTLLGLGVALALAAVGLSPAAHAGSVQDMLGRTVKVPERPARVVSLAPSITETVFALGAGDLLVGVTDHCNYPPEALAKRKIGGIYTPSFESILSVRPDLLLATAESNQPEHIRVLEGLGVPVYVLRPVSLASIVESVRRVGQVIGRPEAGERLAAEMMRDVAAVERAVDGAPRPRALYVVWGDPLIVPGRDAMLTEVIRRAGGDSVTAGDPLPYPRLSMEEALARRPDWIILGKHADTPLEVQLRQWGFLELLPAARMGRVRQVDGDVVHRPGPRIVEALRTFARIFHPDRVP